jgi:hypothetical protein
MHGASRIQVCRMECIKPHVWQPQIVSWLRPHGDARLICGLLSECLNMIVAESMNRPPRQAVMLKDLDLFFRLHTMFFGGKQSDTSNHVSGFSLLILGFFFFFFLMHAHADIHAHIATESRPSVRSPGPRTSCMRSVICVKYSNPESLSCL